MTLYGSGEVDGRPYLLLEYLAGPSLFEVLESMPRRRLHVPDAIRATMHVGAAVHFLHRRGYLYRDLKPANILLRAGIPILVDFDVVRRLDPARRPADRLGTAPYMAPEQVLREPLTPASDVYGLGALLYELLTGHWPTEDPVERRRVGRRVARFAGGCRPRRPPTEPGPPMPNWPPAIRSSNNRRCRRASTAPHMTRELEGIVLRCLERDPRARFQTVSGVLAALAPLLKGRYRLWPKAAPIERRGDTSSR